MNVYNFLFCFCFCFGCYKKGAWTNRENLILTVKKLLIATPRCPNLWPKIILDSTWGHTIYNRSCYRHHNTMPGGQDNLCGEALAEYFVQIGIISLHFVIIISFILLLSLWFLITYQY